MRGIPEVGAEPLLGNLRELKRSPLALLERVHRECGDIGAFRIAGRRVVVIASPTLAAELLIEKADAFEKGPVVRDYARPVWGEGLVAAAADKHRVQRRRIAPLFRPKEVARHTAIMAADTRRLAESLADGAAVDLAAEMQRLTLRIAGHMLFSVDLVDEAPAISEAVTIALEHVTGRIERPVALPLFVPTPRNARVKAAIARLDETMYRLIAERRARGAEPGDLLGSLVAARDELDGSPMTDLEVRDEALTLFLAGHETTANALAWTWWLLATSPAELDALQSEADALPGEPRFEDLPALPNALRAVKEAMRLYPPVHSLGRRAVRSVSIGGATLRKGAIVVVSPYLIHRRPDVFPDPLTFRPSRFAPEEEERVPKGGYLPFGAGVRSCIGSHLALAEAQIVLAGLAREVRFEVDGARPVEPEMLMTMRPRGGIPAIVRRRKSHATTPRALR